MNRISELVVKKQQDDERDPFKKMTSKESLLEDNNAIEQALEYQSKYPFQGGVDEGLANLQDANGKIRHSLSQINALDSNRSTGMQQQ